MKRILLVAIAAAFISPAVAQGATTIIAGDHILAGSTGGQVVQILATGDDMVAGVNLLLQVGDGSGAGPRITNIDLTGPGTIFAGNNVGLVEVMPPPGRQVGVGTVTATGFVRANGILAFVTFDTSGMDLNEFSMFDLLLSVPEWEVQTDWAGTIGVPAPLLVNGHVGLVPEPSSLRLAALAGCGLLLHAVRRRRARVAHVH